VRLVAFNGVLLVVTGVAVLTFGLLARADAAVSQTVRRYAVAISERDLDGALAELVPTERERWRPWLERQLGNVYDVRGIAVRSPSLFDRLLRGAPGAPYEVSILLDVNRDYPDWFYQPSPSVPVEQRDGQWYLSRPPLADRETPAE
jgi:hypothetical protein